MPGQRSLERRNNRLESTRLFLFTHEDCFAGFSVLYRNSNTRKKHYRYTKSKYLHVHMFAEQAVLQWALLPEHDVYRDLAVGLFRMFYNQFHSDDDANELGLLLLQAAHEADQNPANFCALVEDKLTQG